VRSPRRTAGALTAAALLALGLAACSSTGGKPDSSGGSMGAGTADTPRIKIAMVTHAPPGDTFWDLVRKGAETAAAKDNVDLTYQGENKPPTRPTRSRQHPHVQSPNPTRGPARRVHPRARRYRILGPAAELAYAMPQAVAHRVRR